MLQCENEENMPNAFYKSATSLNVFLVGKNGKKKPLRQALPFKLY